MNTVADLSVTASSMAERIDTLFFTLVGITVVVIIAIVGLIIRFAVRYRASNLNVDRSHRVLRNRKLEAAWVLGPLTVFLVLFAWGAKLYAELYRPPGDAQVVYIVGKQWMWQLQHPEGRRELNELHVPVGQPVRLVLTSEDVIHSFFVPALRLKQDAVPGLYTSVWFEANREGRFRFYCAEYCGTQHADMMGTVTVMEPDAYERWLEGESTMAAQGQQLFEDNGCTGCHASDGAVPAPPVAGLLGRHIRLAGGRRVTAGLDYIRESIIEPARQARPGFDPNAMPSFQGQLDELDILKLAEYMRASEPRDPDA
jgi:cytochrome c oxidase subunit 2